MDMLVIFIFASNFSNRPISSLLDSRIKFGDVLLPRCSLSRFYCLASFCSHLFGMD